MTAAILTEGLTKRFGRDLALDDLDLRVEAGEVFGYLGPNGAGKSTTISLLLGFVAPTAGRAELFGIDERGLDKVDRAILTSLCVRFVGAPVGLSTLAISVSEPPETVEDVYEPFLIQQGLLMRTPRGRVPTPAAWAHLGLAEPEALPRPDALFD